MVRLLDIDNIRSWSLKTILKFLILFFQVKKLDHRIVSTLWLLADYSMAKYYVYVIDLDEKVANHKRFRSKTQNTLKAMVVCMSVNPPESQKFGSSSIRRVINQIFMLNFMVWDCYHTFMKNIIQYQPEKMRKILRLWLEKR